MAGGAGARDEGPLRPRLRPRSMERTGSRDTRRGPFAPSSAFPGRGDDAAAAWRARGERGRPTTALCSLVSVFGAWRRPGEAGTRDEGQLRPRLRSRGAETTALRRGDLAVRAARTRRRV
ncbi:hypothetical protein B0H17DRAFT_1065786 [Mycena rosella]|uniref:Uncharacterized protein n=1 Tax=Mycena rosella TaxID=1033263 RepID=A0AAD7DET9_MYCRO|nr:hypothetical protein B0H17DRAFT_1065786 [Mycena rosella]